MLSVLEQIDRAILVCPVTHERLLLQGNVIRSAITGRQYTMVNGIPILVSDPEAAGRYVQSSSRMLQEYGKGDRSGRAQRLSEKLRELVARDYRTRESLAAFRRFLERTGGDSVFLSLGGGPGRAHPELSNVNIGAFPNVDVMADVHRLPYADGSVDGIFCEAGFEHFSDPNLVAREVFRALVPGGKVYSVTPFLQAYHGYPDHYQNLTLSGHRLALERAGFVVIDAGLCVGPLYALFDLGTVFVNEYFPGGLRSVARKLWRLLGIALAPLNRRFNRSARAHVFASTTYCLAEKSTAPGSGV